MAFRQEKLTDREVELMRELRAQGFSYQILSDKFEVSKSCVAMICQFRRRVVVDVIGGGLCRRVG